MLATLAVAVAAALGPPIVLPELEHDVSVALGDDNRVGFAFASLTLGAECGADSTIAHSRAHIAAAAKVLAAHPEADLVLEGHVGVSAPDEIAVAYSRYRAQIVGQILEDEYGVDASRIESRGWGYDVSRIAQQSEHPSASAAKAGYGWVELFFRANPCPHHAPPGRWLGLHGWNPYAPLPLSIWASSRICSSFCGPRSCTGTRCRFSRCRCCCAFTPMQRRRAQRTRTLPGS